MTRRFFVSASPAAIGATMQPATTTTPTIEVEIMVRSTSIPHAAELMQQLQSAAKAALESVASEWAADSNRFSYDSVQWESRFSAAGPAKKQDA